MLAALRRRRAMRAAVTAEAAAMARTRALVAATAIRSANLAEARRLGLVAPADPRRDPRGGVR